MKQQQHQEEQDGCKYLRAITAPAVQRMEEGERVSEVFGIRVRNIRSLANIPPSSPPVRGDIAIVLFAVVVIHGSGGGSDHTKGSKIREERF